MTTRLPEDRIEMTFLLEHRMELRRMMHLLMKKHRAFPRTCRLEHQIERRMMTHLLEHRIERRMRIRLLMKKHLAFPRTPEKRRLPLPSCCWRCPPYS